LGFYPGAKRFELKVFSHFSVGNLKFNPSADGSRFEDVSFMRDKNRVDGARWLFKRDFWFAEVPWGDRLIPINFSRD
jgi:hypothetical protein